MIGRQQYHTPLDFQGSVFPYVYVSAGWFDVTFGTSVDTLPFLCFFFSIAVAVREVK